MLSLSTGAPLRLGRVALISVSCASIPATAEDAMKLVEGLKTALAQAWKILLLGQA